VVSHADGDGCTGPDEYLMRAGYALEGDDGCIAEARHHAVAFGPSPVKVGTRLLITRRA
jgi:hypothetical protein